MQGVFQALSKLLILWAEQRQNEIRPWRLYERTNGHEADLDFALGLPHN